MSARSGVSRLGSMGGDEMRFRLGAGARKTIDRIRFRLRPPAWDRRSLARVLNPSTGPDVAHAAHAALRGRYDEADAALQRHFSKRISVWPVQSRRREQIANAIASSFPSARTAACVDAERILAGRLDVLGYRDLHVGHPPDWHADPVHHRRAPRGFAADIDYLNPAFGDHKVIWEFNRHQHWLALGRAYWLTADARYRTAFMQQLTDWMVSNPPLAGVNWTSMLELAFRCLSWTWALEFFARTADEGRGTGDEAPGTGDEGPWLVDLLIALDRQLAQVSRNLSTYFSPNTHLTGEALALYVVSLALPELGASAARADAGRAVLLREAHRQVRADGGHAELSPHYHRYSTDFYMLALMVARAAADPAAAGLEASLRAQAEYLRAIADDRGRLPLIGDDDGGQLFGFGGRPADASPTLAAAASLLAEPSLAVGPPPVEAFWILGGDVCLIVRKPLAPASRAFPDSGYIIERQGGSQLIFDVGPHGFLNGGHAHADALSIVATIDGDPVLVDPGTATYTMDPAVRDRFRSPRMHNTLTLDGRDFAEAGGPFHWRRTANGRRRLSSSADGATLVQASHDGYPDSAHVRSLVTLPGVGWLVVDHIGAAAPTRADTWWHLHPAWSVSIEQDTVWLRNEGRRSAIAFAGGAVELVDDPNFAVYAPEYGRIERAPLLRMTRTGAQSFALAALIPCRQFASDSLRLRELPVTLPAAPGWLGSAWRLDAAELRLDVLVASSLMREPAPLTSWGTNAIATDAPFALRAIRAFAPPRELASAVH